MRWRAARTLIGTSFRAAPMRAISTFVLSVAKGAIASLFALWLKLLADAAIEGDATRALVAAVGLAISSSFELLMGLSAFAIRVGLEERTAEMLDRQIIEMAATIPGIEHHERADYHDKIELLRQRRDALGTALGALVEVVAMVVRLSTTVALLATIHPGLMALPLFALVSIAAGGRAQVLLDRAVEASAERRRISEHLFTLATTPGPAKELRLFGTRDAVLERHDRIRSEMWSMATRAGARGALLQSAGWLVFGVGYASAIVFVAWQAVNGHATVGDVLLALTLAALINEHVTGLVGVTAWAFRGLRVAEGYLWLVDLARESSKPPADPLPAPERIARGITLERLSFTYPGTEAPVLRDVSLEIPAGSVVAIVGDNGAGKSTLVKLLCRFYEPTGGRILIDDADLSRIPHDQWRARCSAAFQDFARYELIASEVVGVGDVARLDDAAAIAGALERGSAADVPAALPAGLATPLGRSFDDGVELSGGQWQKLALGRAMMREEPLLLALDEPTAALDPQTEHELFERYAAAAHQAATRTGAITVLVSHRFSTVRMADLIVVVDGATVAEAGSHDELMRLGGLYAELYEMQARAYR